MAKKITKRQAERALAQVRKIYKPYIDAGETGPVLGLDPWVG